MYVKLLISEEWWHGRNTHMHTITQQTIFVCIYVQMRLYRKRVSFTCVHMCGNLDARHICTLVHRKRVSWHSVSVNIITNKKSSLIVETRLHRKHVSCVPVCICVETQPHLIYAHIITQKRSLLCTMCSNAFTQETRFLCTSVHMCRNAATPLICAHFDAEKKFAVYCVWKYVYTGNVFPVYQCAYVWKHSHTSYVHTDTQETRFLCTYMYMYTILHIYIYVYVCTHSSWWSS